MVEEVCHGNWFTENSVVYLPYAIDALKTGVGQHLGWNELMQQWIFCLPVTAKSLESRKMRLVLPASWSGERGSTGCQPNWGKQGQASVPQAKPDTPLSMKLMMVNITESIR